MKDWGTPQELYPNEIGTTAQAGKMISPGDHVRVFDSENQYDVGLLC